MIITETADVDESMKAKHACIKTYFVRNRMGEVETITMPGMFVKGPQDLLGAKVILDADPDCTVLQLPGGKTGVGDLASGSLGGALGLVERP